MAKASHTLLLFYILNEVQLLYVHSNERAINLIELSNCLNACACLPKQKLFELKLLPDSIFYLCFSDVYIVYDVMYINNMDTGMIFWQTPLKVYST